MGLDAHVESEQSGRGEVPAGGRYPDPQHVELLVFSHQLGPWPNMHCLRQSGNIPRSLCMVTELAEISATETPSWLGQLSCTVTAKAKAIDPATRWLRPQRACNQYN